MMHANAGIVLVARSRRGAFLRMGLNPPKVMGQSVATDTHHASRRHAAAQGDASMSLEANKLLVANANDAFFNQRDPDAVDLYVGPVYIQHSFMAADGLEALREIIANLGDSGGYESVRLLADGDLVAAHGKYTGFRHGPVVAFQIFRVTDGKLSEHWDGVTPETAPNPSGHTQLDGPTTVTQPQNTEASRALAEAFVDAVLIGGQYDRLPEFISTESYVQHNSQIADGLDGLGAAVAALAKQGISMTYNARHLTVAEGEFVLIQSDGDIGRPVVYYDLFRIDNGKIVEHWDVIQDIPAEMLHGNGMF
jgi:predicted SnoaL-like aldol condensation-catalyzing enzyme